MWTRYLEVELFTEDATDEIDGNLLRLAGVPVPCLLFADDFISPALFHKGGTPGYACDLGAFFAEDGADREQEQSTKVVVFGARFEKAQAEPERRVLSTLTRSH
jgi:hypothetical protein